MNANHLYNENDFPNKLVAFIDILGFKKLILQDKSKALQSISLIDELIKHILWVLTEEHGKSFSTKLFSDCICVSCDYTSENIFFIMYELSYIQFYLSTNGVFLRGGLSLGNHFENDRMIFSHGLIKSYELEKIAMYPRIIIDSELISQISNDNESYFPIYSDFKKSDFLIESPDGKFSIDYLSMLYEEGIEQIEELKNHKNAILVNIYENYDNLNVIEKYHRLAEYHNYKFNEIFDSDDYEANYSKLVIQETTINLQTTFPQFKKPKQI